MAELIDNLDATFDHIERHSIKTINYKWSDIDELFVSDIVKDQFQSMYGMFEEIQKIRLAAFSPNLKELETANEANQAKIAELQSDMAKMNELVIKLRATITKLTE